MPLGRCARLQQMRFLRVRTRSWAPTGVTGARPPQWPRPGPSETRHQSRSGRRVGVRVMTRPEVHGRAIQGVATRAVIGDAGEIDVGAPDSVEAWNAGDAGDAEGAGRTGTPVSPVRPSGEGAGAGGLGGDGAALAGQEPQTAWLPSGRLGLPEIAKCPVVPVVGTDTARRGCRGLRGRRRASGRCDVPPRDRC